MIFLVVSISYKLNFEFVSTLIKIRFFHNIARDIFVSQRVKRGNCFIVSFISRILTTTFPIFFINS